MFSHLKITANMCEYERAPSIRLLSGGLRGPREVPAGLHAVYNTLPHSFIVRVSVAP